MRLKDLNIHYLNIDGAVIELPTSMLLSTNMDNSNYTITPEQEFIQLNVLEYNFNVEKSLIDFSKDRVIIAVTTRSIKHINEKMLERKCKFSKYQQILVYNEETNRPDNNIIIDSLIQYIHNNIDMKDLNSIARFNYKYTLDYTSNDIVSYIYKDRFVFTIVEPSESNILADLETNLPLEKRFYIYAKINTQEYNKILITEDTATINYNNIRIAVLRKDYEHFEYVYNRHNKYKARELLHESLVKEIL